MARLPFTHLTQSDPSVRAFGLRRRSIPGVPLLSDVQPRRLRRRQIEDRGFSARQRRQRRRRRGGGGGGLSAFFRFPADAAQRQAREMRRFLREAEEGRRVSNLRNEQRFLASLGVQQQALMRARQLMSGLPVINEAQLQDIDQQAEQFQAQQMGELGARGLLTTSVGVGLGRAIQQDRMRARQRAVQQGALDFTRTALGTELPIIQGLAGSIEARQDVGPDLGLVAQLAQGAGAADMAAANAAAQQQAIQNFERRLLGGGRTGFGFRAAPNFAGGFVSPANAAFGVPQFGANRLFPGRRGGGRLAAQRIRQRGRRPRRRRIEVGPQNPLGLQLPGGFAAFA